MAGGRCPVSGVRWPVAGGRLPVAGGRGRWLAAGGRCPTATWSSDAIEHERYHGWGMDALAIGQSNMNLNMVLHGWGMDALVTGCRAT